MNDAWTLLVQTIEPAGDNPIEALSAIDGSMREYLRTADHDDPRWHSGDMNDPQVRARDPLTRRFDAAHERRIEMALERLRLPQINWGAVTGRMPVTTAGGVTAAGELPPRDS